MKRVFLVLLIMMSVHAGAYAKDVYVQSIKANIVSEPSFKSQSIVIVDKGSKLQLLETQGRWLKVSFNNQQGWVSKFVVDEHPPVNKVNILINSSKTISNVRKRASAITTAGAARGLSADQRRRANSKGGSNFLDLEKLEALNVTEKDVEQFVLEGRI